MYMLYTLLESCVIQGVGANAQAILITIKANEMWFPERPIF